MNATYTLNHETVLNVMFGKVLRLGTIASFGVLMTGMLLFLMCSLIAMDPPDIPEVTYERFDIWVNPDRVIDPIVDKKVIKPVDPEIQPDIPKLQESFDDVEAIHVVMLPPTGPGEINLKLGAGSGSAIPVFKVAPAYPRRQQSRGVEGFVELMFDITPTGKTENIRVIYAQPEGAFERSSIKALARWKYKPAMDDGVAMAQKNQTTRITYEMEK